MSIYVNGRFLVHPRTGVYRYGKEITQRLGSEVSLIRPESDGKGWRGHIWEQWTLPTKIPANNVVWSPASSGPIMQKNHVVTIHDLAVFDHPKWFDSKFANWYRLILPILARKSEKILTISQFSKQRILERFNVPEKKVEVIYPGVGAPFKINPESESPNIKKFLPRDYLLFVGAFQPRKNLTTLIAAWEEIRMQYPELHLVIVGRTYPNFPGVPIPEDERQIQVIRNLNDEELAHTYRNAKALVYPSLYEGFGFPVLEAMAMGTPVIVSNSSALPEVAGNAGLYFDPFSVMDLVQKLRDFLDNIFLQKLYSQKAIQQAGKFSWQQSIKDILKSLNQI